MQDIDRLIEVNKGLVYAQLHKFNLVDDQEAESIAYEALHKAICDFDKSKGTKLSTVATVYIYNALGSYVRMLNNKRVIKTVSYNNIAYSDDAEDHEFLDLLSSNESTEDVYVHKELCRYTRQVFNELYDTLTSEKHKAILSLWNDSDFTMNTVEISKAVNVSQSYASQVINNFKFKMKKKLEDMYYD